MSAMSGAAFPLGVFVGNPNGNDQAANQVFLDDFDAFRKVMGVSPGYMNAFTDFSQDPSQWAGNASWTAWSWAQTGAGYVGPGSGVVPVIGVPLASNAGGWSNVDRFYQAIIAGDYDADYKGIVAAWAGQGYTTVQMRIAYEFDGNFMPWSPDNSSSPTAAADFVAAWQHVANLVHAQGVASGIAVQTVWNPANINWTGISPTQLYPGDTYVDVVSADAYSPAYPDDLTNWAAGGTGQVDNLTDWAASAANRAHYWQYTDGTQWAPTGNGAGWSFQDGVDFAIAHGKPFSVSETGAGNNGTTTGPVQDPAFAQWLAAALNGARADGAVVENVDIWATDQSDGSWGFLNGEKPEEAAAWALNFGAGSSTVSGGAWLGPVVSAAPAPLPGSGPAPSGSTLIDQGQNAVVAAVYVPNDLPWATATAANPIETVIGTGTYAVIGVHGDGNTGGVLVTSAPVTVGDNQWHTAVTIEANPLFDAAYYLAQNPDVAAAGMNPYQHYLQYGWQEGRNPSAAFDTRDYQAAYGVTGNPLLQYEEYGAAAGRSAIAVPTGGAASDPLINAAYIYAERPDVAAAGLDAAVWWNTTGWKQGVNPDADFDTRYYLAQNPDVAAAGVNPLQHFEQYGWQEGRAPSLVFSDSQYLAANRDVAAAGVNPLAHYLMYGESEGRTAFAAGAVAPVDPLVQAGFYDAQLGATLTPGGSAGAQQAAYAYANGGWQAGLNPDPYFNTAYYLAENPDVAAAHVNPLLHYEEYGWQEGRNPSAGFDTDKYLAAYGDVRAAGMDPLLHYIEYGLAEGRQAFAV